MRFDPLAPALTRVAVLDRTVAAGTRRASKVAKGSTVLVAFSSAMVDGRRVPDSRRFDPRRLPHEYLHFGHGLHTCFGFRLNQALLPRMLKPLLSRPNLHRALGPRGTCANAEPLPNAWSSSSTRRDREEQARGGRGFDRLAHDRLSKLPCG